MEGRSLRSSGGGATSGGAGPAPVVQEEDEEESEEEVDEGKDFSWKKTIMIGPSYQVGIFICFSSPLEKYCMDVFSLMKLLA